MRAQAGCLVALLALVVGTSRVEAQPVSARAHPVTADPARRAAREIAAWAAQLPHMRDQAEHGTWVRDERARWRVRPETECLSELQAAGIAYRRLPHSPELIPTPVEILSPVEGVRFHKRRKSAPFIVACELAVRLVTLARIVRPYGVHAVEVLSAWRRDPRTSYHRAGLAIDVTLLHTDGGTLSVEEHFEPAEDQATCEAPDPQGTAARVLRDIACALAASGRFSTVITPAYNEGHRNHFHLDARPDDPWVFVR